jgi:protein-tyrosine phosphatase
VLECAIDATRVVPGLYIGSKPPRGLQLGKLGVTTLVLAARELQPRSIEFPGVSHVIHVPLLDSVPTQRDLDRAMSAALDIADRVERGETVLVTCSMGRNRSGLIAALAMSLLMCWPPSEAAAYLQMIRVGPDGHPALTNKHFVRALSRMPALC